MEREDLDPLRLFLAEAARRPLLTPAEEVALAKRVERGDATAKQRLIESNLRLVVSVARQYPCQSVPLLDLIQEGALGLDRAAEKFDWRRNCRFSTYATWWIRHSVQRAVAKQGSTIRVPAHILERRRTLALAATRLEVELGREPTALELAHATGLPVRHVDAALVAPAAPVSLSLQVDSDAELGDLVADDNATDPADEVGAALAAADVRLALRRLPERERRVVELRFGFAGEERTVDAIAAELEVTRERVRHLLMHALTRMEHALAA